MTFPKPFHNLIFWFLFTQKKRKYPKKFDILQIEGEQMIQAKTTNIKLIWTIITFI